MCEPVYINEETVKTLLSWPLTFKATEAAMKSVAQERAIQNPRSFTKCRSTETLLLTMPGYLSDENFGGLGCKLVTVGPNNEKLKPPLAKINANITLFDEETGILKAIVAGTEITKWRTAAASAVATKYLKKNFEILAILGAGAQGESHAHCFYNIFEFKEIRIWNHNKPKAEKLVNELNKIYKTQKFKCFESNQECVQNADVIVTATFANQPIVYKEWLKDGAHINAVGAGLNHHSELSESIYLSSHVYIDHKEGAETELSGLKKLGVEFKGEIGSLIAGNLSPSSLNQVTVFQSLGMAVEDCAMARCIYDLYNAKK